MLTLQCPTVLRKALVQQHRVIVIIIIFIFLFIRLFVFCMFVHAIKIFSHEHQFVALINSSTE